LAEPLPFSAEDFRRRVAERLACERGDPVGDHVMNPHLADVLLSMERTKAAVLVPVIHREPEATMLLTVRTGGLRSHAGQIAFPGGRIDADDAGPEEAALREAEEEIGLTQEYVEALCLGPDYLTGSGYHVAPVLAIVRPDFRLRLNAAEVADAFEVPLSFIMNPSNYRQARRFWKGADRNFFEVPWQDRNIWGITAGILRVLYERLYSDDLGSKPR
jgi:8-oxo-dGTP pyrophosphatase MutT (NUDIX family)